MDGGEGWGVGCCSGGVRGGGGSEGQGCESDGYEMEVKRVEIHFVRGILEMLMKLKRREKTEAVILDRVGHRLLFILLRRHPQRRR